MLSYLHSKRRPLAWIAGTVGAAYLAAQWGYGKVTSYAKEAAAASSERENLKRRFKFHLQDCLVAIENLLPSLRGKLEKEMDVEGLSKELAGRTAKERADRAAESERAERERQESESRTYAQVAAADEEAPDPEEQPATVELAADADVAATGVGAQPSEQLDGQEQAEKVEAAEGEREQQTDSQDQGERTYAQVAADVGVGVDTAVDGTAASDEQAVPPAAVDEQLDIQKDHSAEAAEAEKKEPEREKVVDLAAQETTGDQGSEPLPQRTKAELWEEIKILSITRTLTALYTLSLLSLLTHVQLALLGQRNYLGSVLSTPSFAGATPSALEKGLKQEEKAKEESRREREAREEEGLLLMGWWGLNVGVERVGRRMRREVESVFGSLELRKEVSFTEFGDLLQLVISRVSASFTSSAADDDAKDERYTIAELLLPSTASDRLSTLDQAGFQLAELPEGLSKLLDEAADLIDSPDALTIHQLSISRVLSVFVRSLEPAFRPRGPQKQQQQEAERERGARFEDVGERRARLAAVMPSVARGLGGLTSAQEDGNEYLAALGAMEELKEWSVLMFTGWDKDSLHFEPDDDDERE